MENVILEADYSLNLGWVYMHGLNVELVRYRGMEGNLGKTIYLCVGMSVKK